MPAVILITGANKGIGLEAARELSALGHTVIVGSRDRDRGRSAAAEVGGNSEAIAIDVTDEGSCRAAAAEIEKRFGRLDVLVNNAGVLIERGTLPSQIDADQLRTTLETNVYGVIRCTQAMLPLLRKGAGARIINVSSNWGSVTSAAKSGGNAQEYAPAYQTSKAALNLWTAALAAELRSEGFSVNAVCPGWCRTDMGTQAATRSASQGAAIIVKLATESSPPTAGFWNDAGSLPW